MSTDLALCAATELVALFRAKQASPVEATEAVLARIERLTPKLNAFRQVEPESALAAARESEARWARGEPAGRVDGVPTTIKDLILTRGWPTLRGSRTVSAEQPWDDDAPATARLREHGAVLLGKTTTPEFGWKGVTDSPLTGITRNPWNTERTPGGSSGGAAAAAAVGMGALHIGTDAGGSVRIPAGLTGIVGHKGTYGRVPAWPHSPFGTLANVGPMTRTVADAALMLTVIAEPDVRDWFALPYDGADFTEGLEDGVRGMRIGFSPAPGGATVDPAIADLVAAAARTFEELGAHVGEADPPVSGAHEIFQAHWKGGAAYLFKDFTAEQKALMDPELVEISEAGARMPVTDYVAGVEARRQLGFAMHRFMQDYDLLLTPTLPVTAFPVGQGSPDAEDEPGCLDWTPFTYPFNLSRQPAVTVPCGLTPDGLPAGLQIVGPLYEDARVLRAARAFETARPWALPPMATDA